MKPIALLAGAATAFAVNGLAPSRPPARPPRNPGFASGQRPGSAGPERPRGAAGPQHAGELVMATHRPDLFAALDAPLVVAPSAWTGHFVFEQAPTTHRLVIGPGRCLLTTERQGVVERVDCDAIARGDSLILLAAAGGGYRPGTPLLKLCRGESGIVTHWLGYDHAPAAPIRRCFVRRWS